VCKPLCVDTTTDAGRLGVGVFSSPKALDAKVGGQNPVIAPVIAMTEVHRLIEFFCTCFKIMMKIDLDCSH